MPCLHTRREVSGGTSGLSHITGHVLSKNGSIVDWDNAFTLWFSGAVARNKDYCIPVSPSGGGYFGRGDDQPVLVNGTEGDQCQLPVHSGHCSKCAKSLCFFSCMGKPAGCIMSVQAKK